MISSELSIDEDPLFRSADLSLIVVQNTVRC